MPALRRSTRTTSSIPPAMAGHALTATLSGHRATAPVAVKDYSTATTWSFRNDVLPVMTKVGCNSGPCHGAAAGKNGFKLTLRGYDPVIGLLHTYAPGAGAKNRSTGACKKPDPAEADAHHFPRGREALRRRIARVQRDCRMARPGDAGAQDSDALVKEIEVLPHEASLVPGAEQQLIVTAIFSDGRQGRRHPLGEIRQRR